MYYKLKLAKECGNSLEEQMNLRETITDSTVSFHYACKIINFGLNITINSLKLRTKIYKRKMSTKIITKILEQADLHVYN